MRESLKNFGEPDEFFRVTIAGMEWYHKFFGIPYPFTKYDQIFTPEYNFGAMENVELVTYNKTYCWKDKPTQQRRS
jgi:aminopeptidase N